MKINRSAGEKNVICFLKTKKLRTQKAGIFFPLNQNKFFID